MTHFDFIIVVGGAAAFGAAVKANDRGAETAVISCSEGRISSFC